MENNKVVVGYIKSFPRKKAIVLNYPEEYIYRNMYDSQEAYEASVIRDIQDTANQKRKTVVLTDTYIKTLAISTLSNPSIIKGKYIKPNYEIELHSKPVKKEINNENNQ